MMVKEIILDAVWITDQTNIIIKYLDKSGASLTLAEGRWGASQILYWGGGDYNLVKLEMNFDRGEAVFYIA